jgi:hypothetical protein
MIVIIASGWPSSVLSLAVVATKVALGLTGFVAAGGIAAVVLHTSPSRAAWWCSGSISSLG